MDIKLELGASAPEFVRELREAQKALIDVRDENLKLGQEVRARATSQAGVETQLINAFVGASKALEVQKKLTQEVNTALGKQETAGKQAGDSTAKSAKDANTALEVQRKTLDKLQQTMANLQGKGITGAAVVNTQRAIDMTQANIAALEAPALQGDTKATEDNTTAKEQNEQVTESLRTERRRLQQQIAQMLVDGKQETELYAQLIERAGELDDAMKDANSSIARAGSDTSGLDNTLQLAGGVAAGFTAAQGAVALFDGENEALQETLVKLNAAMAITQGLQQVQAVLRDESIKALITENLNRVKNNVQQVITNGLESESVVIRTAATVAQRILNATMSENPIGFIATALVFLIGAFVTYKLTIGDVSAEEIKAAAAAEALTKARVNAASKIAEEQVALERNLNTLKNEVSTRGQVKTALEAVRSAYPEYLGYLTREQVLSGAAADAIARQIELIKQKALVAAAEDIYKEKLEAQLQAQLALDESVRQNTEMYEQNGLSKEKISSSVQHATELEAKALDRAKAATDGVHQSLNGMYSSLTAVSHKTSEELDGMLITLNRFAADAPVAYQKYIDAIRSGLKEQRQANTDADTKEALDKTKQAFAIQLAASKENTLNQLSIRRAQITNQKQLDELDIRQSTDSAEDKALKIKGIEAEAAKANRDLNKEYAAASKERLQSQIDANNKLLEAQNVLQEAQIASQKETLGKELETIHLSYQQRIAGLQQSIKAEELRIQGNDKITALEREAVIKANAVRQETIKQLRVNEQKETTDATLKFNTQMTSLQLDFESQKLELQKDSLNKSIESVKLEGDQKINAAKIAYKDYPEKLAEIEVDAEKYKNEKIKELRQQYALDQLDQQKKNSVESIDAIAANGADEAVITRVKENLKLAIEKDFAQKRLDLLLNQVGLEGEITQTQIKDYQQYLRNVKKDEVPLSILDFLKLSANLTSEQKEQITSAVSNLSEATAKIAGNVFEKSFDSNGNFSLNELVMNSLSEAFDLNPEEEAQMRSGLTKAYASISDSFHQITEALSAEVDAQISVIDKRISKIDEQINKQKEAVDAEKDLMDRGLANTYKNEKDRLAALESAKQVEIQQKEELERKLQQIRKAEATARSAEIAAKTIETEVTLITAAAKAVSGHAGIPFVGVALGLAAAAALVAGFIAIKSTMKAASADVSSTSYRQGGEFDLMNALNGQPSHEQRGVDVVNRSTGQKLAEFEGDEKLFIVNRGFGKQYINVLKAVNDGSIANWDQSRWSEISPRSIKPVGIYLNDDLLPNLLEAGDKRAAAGQSVYVLGGSINTASDTYLGRIAHSNEAMLDLERSKEIIYQDGDDLIVVKGNSIRRIKK